MIAPYTCSRVREQKFWRMVSGESPALKEYTMESREYTCAGDVESAVTLFDDSLRSML